MSRIGRAVLSVLGAAILVVLIIGSYLGFREWRVDRLQAAAVAEIERFQEMASKVGLQFESNSGVVTDEDAQAANAALQSFGAEEVSVVPSGTVCPTTAQAKQLLGVDVQKLDTEYCAWVFRSVGVGVFNEVANSQFIHTLHLANGNIQVFTGDGQTRQAVAMTARFIGAYPLNDAVHQPCQLLVKEQEFGHREVPGFEVTAGNFSCGSVSSSAPTSVAVAPTSAPAALAVAPTSVPVVVVNPTAVPATAVPAPTQTPVVSQPLGCTEPPMAANVPWVQLPNEPCAWTTTSLTWSGAVPVGADMDFPTGKVTAGNSVSVTDMAATFRWLPN